jgi:hypothetical protein
MKGNLDAFLESITSNDVSHSLFLFIKDHCKRQLRSCNLITKSMGY